MDPNAALEQFRALWRDFLAEKAYSPESWDAAVAAVDTMANLDEWLSKGGFLPAEWSKS